MLFFFFFILASYPLIIALSIFVICVYGYKEDKPIIPIPKACPAEDSPDRTVMLAHDRYCSKYYMCSGGIKIEMDCPKSWNGCLLHFNRKLQVCDYPGRAGCRWNTDYETVPSKCIKPSEKYVNNYGEEVEEE